MHKMCSDERKCAVMKGCLCSDELRINKWRRGPMQYLLLREHKARCRNVKNSMRVCIQLIKGFIVCKQYEIICKTRKKCVQKFLPGKRGVKEQERVAMCQIRKGRRS